MQAYSRDVLAGLNFWKNQSDMNKKQLMSCFQSLIRLFQHSGSLPAHPYLSLHAYSVQYM